MNYKIMYYCPTCRAFKSDNEMLARLHCAPEAITVFECEKCGKTGRDIYDAMDCCTERKKGTVVEIVEKKGQPKQTRITLPGNFDVDDL